MAAVVPCAHGVVVYTRGDGIYYPEPGDGQRVALRRRYAGAGFRVPLPFQVIAIRDGMNDNCPVFAVQVQKIPPAQLPALRIRSKGNMQDEIAAGEPYRVNAPPLVSPSGTDSRARL